jgi:hypothetical protein
MYLSETFQTLYRTKSNEESEMTMRRLTQDQVPKMQPTSAVHVESQNL